MDVGIVEAVLANIAAQMAGVVQALVPLGTALAGSFLVLSILLLGLNLIVGGSFTAAIVRSMGAAAATFWAVQQWPDLVMGTLTASRDIIGLFIGGYGGPTDLFQAAAEVDRPGDGRASRVELVGLRCGRRHGPALPDLALDRLHRDRARHARHHGDPGRAVPAARCRRGTFDPARPRLPRDGARSAGGRSTSWSPPACGSWSWG